jgi:hypothetical protein
MYGRCDAWICEECDVAGYCHSCQEMKCPHVDWNDDESYDKMPNMRERNYIPN